MPGDIYEVHGILYRPLLTPFNPVSPWFRDQSGEIICGLAHGLEFSMPRC
jgi:hypothetical protein